MNYYAISEAILFASKVHHGKLHKGKQVPYIEHPLAVALLLSSVSQDHDLLVAGILHDTIEDCDPYGSVTRDTLAKLFGERVADLVNDVTEQDKSLPWDERKAHALKHIELMSNDSMLLKTADVLHNLTELLIDINAEGQSVFLKFNTSKEKTLERYRKLTAVLKKRWPSNPLLEELSNQCQKLLSLSEK